MKRMFWFFRMKRWAQNPPSAKMVILVICVIAFVAALAIFEHYAGWPEALTPTKPPRGMIRP